MIPTRTAFVERRDRALLTPEYEDAGLFKSDILRLSIEVTPIMFRNSRQDVIVRCYHDATHSFEVTFAGRRSQMATPLIERLEKMKAKNATAKTPASDRDLTALRVPIKVEGVWRRRFWTDTDGWLTRVHQFVAARWTVESSAQKPVMFGVPPAIGPMAPVG